MKNTLDGFIRKLDTAEGRLSELGQDNKNFKTEKQRGKSRSYHLVSHLD